MQEGDERGKSKAAAARKEDWSEREPRPYKLVACTDQGLTSSSQLRSDQWYYAIDWGAEAAAQYDPGCIEEPQLHKSMRQAKARAAAGPKPYNLDECIEVRPTHMMTLRLRWRAICERTRSISEVLCRA